VKGSEKQWYPRHADEMLALRCHALSEDGRWDDHFDALRRGEIEIPTPGRARAAGKSAATDSRPRRRQIGRDRFPRHTGSLGLGEYHTRNWNV